MTSPDLTPKWWFINKIVANCLIKRFWIICNGSGTLGLQGFRVCMCTCIGVVEG